MSVTLEEIMLDSDLRLERGSALVREVVAREGPEVVVKTAAKLLERGQDDAVLFLEEGLSVPELRAAIESSDALRAAVATLLPSKRLHDREVAISALERLPMEGASELLLAAGKVLLAEGDILSVAAIVAITGPSTITADLLKSDDWLLRWAVVSWTNTDATSALATTVREQLANDPSPLVAAEAAQHVAALAALTAAGGVGITSNHGRALSFRTVTSRFVAFWPPDKTSYTLEELRAFIEDQTKR